MALSHLMIRIIYVMLRDKVPYEELGPLYLESKEKPVEYGVRKIREMGYEFELTEAPVYSIIWYASFTEATFCFSYYVTLKY